MGRTWVETLTDDLARMGAFRQKTLILEVTELISWLMEDRGIPKAQLDDLLVKDRSHVTRLLNGRANMSLRTITDVMFALDNSLRVEVGVVAASSTGEAQPALETESQDGDIRKRRAL